LQVGARAVRRLYLAQQLAAAFDGSRLEARAIRRASEVLQEIPAGKTGPKSELDTGAVTQLNRTEAFGTKLFSVNSFEIDAGALYLLAGPTVPEAVRVDGRWGWREA
jgi:hypothetical protein